MENSEEKKQRKVRFIEVNSKADFEAQVNQALSEGFRILKWNADSGQIDFSSWQAIMLKDDFQLTESDYMEITTILNFEGGRTESKLVTSSPSIIEHFKQTLVFLKPEKEG